MRRNIGEFERIVLLAMVRMGDKAYGIGLMKEIADRTGRRTTIGSMYSTLNRMQAKGFIKSHVGKKTPLEESGHARRYFRLTAAGYAALKASLEAIHCMAKGTPYETPDRRRT